LSIRPDFSAKRLAARDPPNPEKSRRAAGLKYRADAAEVNRDESLQTNAGASPELRIRLKKRGVRATQDRQDSLLIHLVLPGDMLEE
jgi:hypothetical protein